MSLDCSVFTRMVPDNLESLVLEELAIYGYDCEFHPESRLTSDIATLWVRVKRFPAIRCRVRPDVSLIFGFDYAYWPPGSSSSKREDEVADFPHLFFLRTAMGRSDLSAAVQLMIGASLARVTDSIYDSMGDFMSAIKAMNSTLDIIRRKSLAHDVGATPFTGWPSLDPLKESEFAFSDRIEDPSPKKRPWWKIWTD